MTKSCWFFHSEALRHSHSLPLPSGSGLLPFFSLYALPASPHKRPSEFSSNFLKPFKSTPAFGLEDLHCLPPISPRLTSGHLLTSTFAESQPICPTFSGIPSSLSLGCFCAAVLLSGSSFSDICTWLTPLNPSA